MTREERVAGLMSQHMSVEAIATKMGISRATVRVYQYRIRVARGEPRLRHKVDQSAVLELLHDGMTQREVVRRLGVSSAAVRYYRRKLGVTPVRQKESGESLTDARSRVAADVAVGKRCRKCHSPVGDGCTATACGLRFDSWQRRSSVFDVPSAGVTRRQAGGAP